MTSNFTITGYPPHTLTITEVDGDLRYKLTCDGVTEACMAWMECYSTESGSCPVGELENAERNGDDEPVVHGIRHRHLDIGWAVPTGDCWLLSDPDWPEPARELSLPAGTYRVRHRYEDRGEFYTLSLVEYDEEAR